MWNYGANHFPSNCQIGAFRSADKAQRVETIGSKRFDIMRYIIFVWDVWTYEWITFNEYLIINLCFVCMIYDSVLVFVRI